MTAFSYRAKDKSGEIKSGTIDAASVVKAAEALHGAGLTVLDLAPEAKGGFNIDQYLSFLNHVSKKEIVIFSRQLATLINAKVPIIQAFEILLSQITNRALKNAIAEMMNDIEGGKSLSEAVAVFPHIFSDLYVNLVKSGELSGTLDQSLVYLANQQEKDYELTSKIRGAMTYPIFIVSAILIVGALMFVFVLPQMIGVLKEADVELPVTTKILIFVTDVLQNYWGLIFALTIGLGVGSQFYIRSSGGRIVWDHIKLKLPVFGKLFRNIYMNRFARNLSTLVEGGIPIVQALKTVAEIVGNMVYKQIILEAASEVETGKSIATVFVARPEIPAIVTQMVRVGEQTGTLHEILGKLADFYDKEVANTLGTLTTLLEPIIMMLLGLAVAVMVAGILLPIYNLASVQ
ncbi:MAG: hypothetical protein A3C85_03105 [Candidatus Doudnabacteria bacterium RIFCSPHIGHO2_02_FULL_48_21]|uniref:Type II secretion system protein GspF domain-containing protein n=1 Tax=Candidatus Doudnabacteria bacterium RIFCSPLOWO2_02_FULL_48_13 TaxID=1817845 RepID=A0A1F5QBZ8_9BACT|nr:MAG: hypothetical protein A3K05_00365 [Candidatus Doudnabacteria bacterium RIFCSPHIGHO2_01_48_18]OGE77093.1 MAG: hypothetical protein A2668_02475 [Candidatus Doudnabacteria bacterium RIFCSPHIGHO2_01_FULL_48_180]OGE91634.1 MAG: hypothetical protein A3F44_02935 [Candidatus Doudnabacteria bacterium RIFCSPHIGHO2_12_FULL_47_25]OGE93248.1 MAG: hypothetical protein A3C85_03105 [Candidatus Doudnabacteria bacterium RIFCSPHIGHO2_02_FULL_48_21]OGE96371.1 MAG: hypothetical protein A3A83_01350 [Candidatu